MPIFTCRASGKPDVTLAAESPAEAALDYAEFVGPPEGASLEVQEFISLEVSCFKVLA